MMGRGKFRRFSETTVLRVIANTQKTEVAHFFKEVMERGDAFFFPIVHVRVDFFFRNHGRAVVEPPGLVRTCGHAVPASDAPVPVHHDDAVLLPLPRRLCRTHPGAGRVVAMVAQQQDVLLGGEAVFLAFESGFSNPVDVVPLVPVKGHVVLRPAGIQTGSAFRPAFREIDHHAPPAAGQWSLSVSPPCTGFRQHAEGVYARCGRHGRPTRGLQKISSVL